MADTISQRASAGTSGGQRTATPYPGWLWYQERYSGKWYELRTALKGYILTLPPKAFGAATRK